MSQQATSEEATVTVSNVGGLEECAVSFRPGVTILAGQNATGRTSLLAALTSALGGSAGTLKSDRERGEVTLTLDGETYGRSFTRSDGRLSVDGDPYTDRSGLVDLFASLLEGNAARLAVQRGDDLRELLMRPVDTASIRARIRELESERADIDARLSEIARERERLPALESRKADLDSELDAVSEEVESLQATIDEHEADPEAADAAHDALNELDRLRQRLNRLQGQAETHREALRALREERSDAESELEGAAVDDEALAAIDEELSRLQERERTVSDLVTELSAIVEFNEDLLANEGLSLDAGDVTDRLSPETELIECWTCGSEVQRGAVRDRLDALRETIAEKRETARELRAELSELREERSTLQQQQTERERLERRLSELDRDIERRERRLADTEAGIETVREEIREQERQVRETESLRDSDLLDAYEELSEAQYERGQIEQRLSETTAELERLRGLADERDSLEARRDELEEELADERTRIESLEREAVEAFNTRMGELLDLLEYGNIARVWIERVGAGDDATFELHVVRENDDGAVYEDSVATLSESEREVIGLVVALSGYLVHEVYEVVPMMLLDSLEAIDATRIARLVDYFAEHVPYLVVALLEEDARALDDAYERIPATEFTA